MSLNWDATFAVAVALRRNHPNADLSEVSLGQVLEWTLALPEFDDDPNLCNDEILAAIYQEWYEVTLHD
jgi:FeS assembly protein IscX